MLSVREKGRYAKKIQLVSHHIKTPKLAVTVRIALKMENMRARN